MDAHHQHWNANHKELREKLTRPESFEAMRQLLLNHHAMLHASGVTQAEVWSYADEIWQGLTEADVRKIPPKQEHSIVWIIWHIARIEDITMNILAAGRPAVFETDHWLERLHIPLKDTGNAIRDVDLTALNETVDVAELRAYRLAVGKQTQALIRDLQPDTVKQKVDAGCIQQLRDSGAVVEAASEIVDYWSKRTIAGLLMMPATRHNFVHLNEASRIKRALA